MLNSLFNFNNKTIFLLFKKTNNFYLNFFVFAIFYNYNFLFLNINFFFFYKKIWFKDIIKNDLNLKNAYDKIFSNRFLFTDSQNYRYNYWLINKSLKNNKNVISKNLLTPGLSIFNWKPFYFLFFFLKHFFLFFLYTNFNFFYFLNNFKTSNFKITQFSNNTTSFYNSLRIIKNKNLLNFNFKLI